LRSRGEEARIETRAADQAPNTRAKMVSTCL